RANREQLAERYPGWEFQVVRELGEVRHTGGPSGDSDRPRVPAPLGPEIAHWLLIAVLVLLFAEAIMAWQFGHYTGATGQEATASAGHWLPGVAAGVIGLAVLVIGGTLLHYAVTGEFLGYLPDAMRHKMEQWRGLGASAPGEANHWDLLFSSSLSDTPQFDPW